MPVAVPGRAVVVTRSRQSGGKSCTERKNVEVAESFISAWARKWLPCPPLPLDLALLGLLRGFCMDKSLVVRSANEVLALNGRIICKFTSNKAYKLANKQKNYLARKQVSL